MFARMFVTENCVFINLSFLGNTHLIQITRDVTAKEIRNVHDSLVFFFFFLQHDHHHHEPGMPFDFNYAVKEDAFGNDYSHNAISDGDIVRGEYRVQLPDGRTQVVRYTADWQHGFSAQVSYDGTPRFDIPRPGGNFNRGY